MTLQFTRPADPPARAGVGAVREVALAGAAALGVNLLVLALGSAVDVDFRVVSFIGGREEVVGLQAVTVMTVVPWLLGAALLAATRQVKARAWPWLTALGAALAVATVPFFNDAEASTKLTLGLMHAAAGALWVLTVQRVSRRAGLRAPEL